MLFLINKKKDRVKKNKGSVGSRSETVNKNLIQDLHLLVPTFDEPANQGSSMNTQRKVSQRRMPRNSAGLSLKRRPFRNQCTVCFRFEDFRLMATSGVCVCY